MTLKDIFSEIEKRSEFVFFYQDDFINKNKTASVSGKNMTIYQILDKLFATTGNTYEVINRQVFIYQGNEKPTVKQQVRGIPISGSVLDEDGVPLIGVTVNVAGTITAVMTDINGEYKITVPSDTTTLRFSFIGFQNQDIKVADRRIITVIMKVAAQSLEDVVVVGFGTQKKESLVSAITTISPKELKGPTSNLTTMLAGRIAGIISYQRSGEPGNDNAEFFIRGLGTFGSGKRDPLILIDGIESSNTDLARLQPNDIAAFSVLKDATASAVYGARGANGVVLVNTKKGEDGKTKFSFHAENSISSNTRNFKFADNITYMELANEARLTRIPESELIYSKEKIEQTRLGTDPILYPSNNWIDQLIKDYTMNQRFNINVIGGGRAARFYISGTLNIDNGVLKNDNKNDFNNNISLKNFAIRSNIDLQLTKSTEATVRVYGQFDDYAGPIGGGTEIFNSATKANPVAFPAIYPASFSPTTKHPMFGSALVPNMSNTLYNNPYAQMVSGYQTSKTSNITAQIELKQDFSFILSGLKARVMGYTKRNSFFATSRSFNPFFYKTNITSTGVNLVPFNDGGLNSIPDFPVGTEYLNYKEGDKIVNSELYGEAALTYDQTFAKKHAVSGMLIGILRDYVTGNAGSLELSLPSRNMGLSGRFSYIFDSRYLLEFNFGYNASERFARHNRWGFFPSIGGGWIISNEKFFEPLQKSISNLKLRASYGLIGNDQIGEAKDRFFYMSNVNLADDARGYSFGSEFGYKRPGVSMSRYANNQIGWEESRQTNIGLDFNLFGVNVTTDIYKQERSHILQTRSFIPSTLGLQVATAANTGKAESSGIDISMDYNKYFQNGIWTQLRANFTYSSIEVKVTDEPTYPANEYYRSKLGYPFQQEYGYVAERLFVDDYEIANSPSQNFGTEPVLAGDIKYRDVNGDGKITEADKVPIGFPTTPEIIYGFGGTVGYKNFDFSAFFQGSARSSFFIAPSAISPYAPDEKDARKQNGLLEDIANSHWSEDHRNLYAFWPRLSYKQNDNNNQTSTWWMRNGAFLRLKSIELGYNLPEKKARKFGLSNLRLYLNATNLFVISKFKMWDPEMGGNGLGYPVQRVYNIGIRFDI